MTAVEAYELTTRGGATDFARLITMCEAFGPYCLIGGLAVNSYVEPVYTLDADLVVIASSLSRLSAHLQEQAPGSELRVTSSQLLHAARHAGGEKLISSAPSGQLRSVGHVHADQE